MEDFKASDLYAYTFEDFFVRQHAPKSRPIFEENNSTKAVAIADSRVVVYPTVQQALYFPAETECAY
jgi:phosphatidylserine decarboxylase